MGTEPIRHPRSDQRTPRIPGYEIEGTIGRGASGVVYRARQLAVDRVVALKVLHRELSANPRIVRRLQREARTTARLAHPHVVSAIDMGETDGAWWYAMELVEGTSLSLRLREDGRLTERQALRLFIPLCEALEHLHQHGVVHRDIKPANILIDSTRGARLADLGLAFADDDPELTRQGGTLGTPHYMSPEQAIDPRRADVRSDLWSFGATLFHAVCGRPPFVGDSTAQVLSAVLYARIPDPLDLEPSLSKGLALVLRKCLVRDPELRYQHPRDLLQDLERLRERRAPAVRRSTLDPVARRGEGGALLWAGALLVVLCAGAWAVTVWRGEPEAERQPARAEPDEYAPLVALSERAAHGSSLLAQRFVELAELSAGLPLRFEEQWRAVDRELRNRLRTEVSAVCREIDAEVERELAARDYAAAWTTLERELNGRLRLRTGFQLEELERTTSIEPWKRDVVGRVNSATLSAMQALSSSLEDWRQRRMARIDELVGAHEWSRAFALVDPDDATLLREAGFLDSRLPAEQIEEVLSGVQLDFAFKRRELEARWASVDRDLVAWIERRAKALRAELEGVGEPFHADRELVEAFEGLLEARRLRREALPPSAPILSTDRLASEAETLRSLEDALLERGRRAEVADNEELGEALAAERNYAQMEGIWREFAAELDDPRGIPDAAWRAELGKRAALRLAEARLLLDVRDRVVEALRQRDGTRVDLTLRGITHASKLLTVGADPVTDGFRLEGVAERLGLSDLTQQDYEALAGLADRAGLSRHERLELALLRFHERRGSDASAALAVLRAGALPEEGIEGELAADLRQRVTAALESRGREREAREAEVERWLRYVFDPAHVERSPTIVRERIRELLSDYEDLQAVRDRRHELRKLLDALTDPDATFRTRTLEGAYRPARLTTPRYGRARLEFDFQEPDAGAWERRDWICDGAGWRRRASAEGWDEVRDQNGPQLILRRPVDVDAGTLELALQLALPAIEPPRLVAVSAIGFHVVLTGPGLPAPDRASRWLVSTKSLDDALERVRGGEGKRREPLLVAGETQTLVLRLNRRSGKVEVVLDGQRLGEQSLSPPPLKPVIVVRAWDPVWLTGAALEVER